MADHHRPPHAGPAERFAHFLEACSLDKAAFVAGVDGAVDARSLYPVLNGTRRPSRALAVLIERTWGFRADYLLHGHEPRWVDPRPGGVGAPDDRSDGPGLTAFEKDLIDFVRRSLDNVHSLKLDLDRGLLWERLFARTAELVARLDRAASPSGDRDAPVPLPADRRAAAVAVVFDDCTRAADAFERFTLAVHRRRALHLTLVYFDRFLPTEGEAGLAERNRTARQRARAALQAAEAEVDACRDQLERILDLPSPLDLLGSDPADAETALAAIVASSLPA